MLRKEHIRKYFFSKTASAIKHLEKFNKKAEPDELHHFRVDIKKLKAVLILVKSHHANGHLLKLFKPINQVFKKAGDIRTIDVNLDLISGFPDVKKNFVAKLQKQRKEKAKKFGNATKRNSEVLNDCCKKISESLFDIDERYIHRKFRKHTHKAAVSFSRNQGDMEELHNNRKKIKMLIYTYEHFPDTISKKLNINKRYLTKVQSTIGDFHDRALARDILAVARYKNTRDFQQIAIDMEKKQRSIEKLTKDFEKKVNLKYN